jgi:hypothetical protein
LETTEFLESPERPPILAKRSAYRADTTLSQFQSCPEVVVVHLFPHVGDLAPMLKFLALRLLAALERLQVGDFSA